MKVASEVSQALSQGLAVVALESTIISHGFLYPYSFHFLPFSFRVWTDLLFIHS